MVPDRRDPASGTGADGFTAALLEAGVRVAFGLPGVHNLPLFTTLASAEQFRLVGVRHEQTAAYAADGYARVTGRLGVALTTTGPGAVNAATATGEALACGSPILVVATDISSELRLPGVSRGALHEVSDQAAIFAPLTKATLRASTADEIALLTSEACRRALTPPAGPVFLEIPTDLLRQFGAAAAGLEEPGADRAPVPEPSKLGEAISLLAAADRPLIWAGGGAARSPEAREAISGLAERLCAPVIETNLARGLLDPSHPCRVGVPQSVPEAGALWDEADAVLAIGSDLDGINTQNWRLPVPPALVAINVDGADAAKNYSPDVLLLGDAAEVARLLAEALPSPRRDLGELEKRLSRLRLGVRGRLSEEEPRAFALLDSLGAWPPGAPIACDMCIPGYWAAGFFDFATPRSLLYPMGWGTLGFALPAAIGAALGSERGRALCICGDGGFLFACGELATLAQERVPLTILLVDDGGYGMLRYDFESAGKPPVGVDLETPDWDGLAESFGIPSQRVGDLGDSLRQVLEDQAGLEGPSLIHTSAALIPPETTSPRWYRAQ